MAAAAAIGKIADAMKSSTPRQRGFFASAKRSLDKAILIEALLAVTPEPTLDPPPLDIPGALERARAAVQKALAR